MGQRQFNNMMDIMNKYHLIQTVEEKTRKNNTLDLVFTNNLGIITQIDVTGTIMSDHDIIEIATHGGDNTRKIIDNETDTQPDEMDLRQLNFHHKQVDWIEIKEILKVIPWEKILKGLKNVQNCLYTALKRYACGKYQRRIGRIEISSLQKGKTTK